MLFSTCQIAGQCTDVCSCVKYAFPIDHPSLCPPSPEGTLTRQGSHHLYRQVQVQSGSRPPTGL